MIVALHDMRPAAQLCSSVNCRPERFLIWWTRDAKAEKWVGGSRMLLRLRLIWSFVRHAVDGPLRPVGQPGLPSIAKMRLLEMHYMAKAEPLWSRYDRVTNGSLLNWVSCSQKGCGATVDYLLPSRLHGGRWYWCQKIQSPVEQDSNNSNSCYVASFLPILLHWTQHYTPTRIPDSNRFLAALNALNANHANTTTFPIPNNFCHLPYI